MLTPDAVTSDQRIRRAVEYASGTAAAMFTRPTMITTSRPMRGEHVVVERQRLVIMPGCRCRRCAPWVESMLTLALMSPTTAVTRPTSWLPSPEVGRRQQRWIPPRKRPRRFNDWSIGGLKPLAGGVIRPTKRRHRAHLHKSTICFLTDSPSVIRAAWAGSRSTPRQARLSRCLADCSRMSERHRRAPAELPSRGAQQILRRRRPAPSGRYPPPPSARPDRAPGRRGFAAALLC